MTNTEEAAYHLSTILPRGSHGELLDWSIRCTSNDQNRVRMVCAYMALCRELGWDTREYHGFQGE